MWIWGKKFSKDAEKRYALMNAAWETDKNELALGRGDIFICGKTYNALNVGYYVHSLEKFSDLVPTALDIMNALLKGCFVFTHIYRDFPGTAKKKAETNQRGNPAFAEYYIAFLKAHNWQDGEYFYNGRDCLVTFTKGIDMPTLKAFYDVFDGAPIMEGLIYGFLKSPRDIAGNDYASIADFLSKDKHDILMLFSNYHVNLYIHLNSEHFNEEEVIQVITSVCKRYSKKLNL